MIDRPRTKITQDDLQSDEAWRNADITCNSVPDAIGKTAKELGKLWKVKSAQTQRRLSEMIASGSAVMAGFRSITMISGGNRRIPVYQLKTSMLKAQEIFDEEVKKFAKIFDYRPPAKGNRRTAGKSPATRKSR